MGGVNQWRWSNRFNLADGDGLSANAGLSEGQTLRVSAWVFGLHQTAAMLISRRSLWAVGRIKPPLALTCAARLVSAVTKRRE